MKYTVTVVENSIPNPRGVIALPVEVFKFGIDEFEPVRFVTALTAPKIGRPRSAKREQNSVVANH